MVYSLAGPGCQHLERRSSKNDTVVVKKLFDAYLDGGQTHRTRDIPVSKEGLVIEFGSNNENLLGFGNLTHFGQEGLGLSIRDLKGVHYLDFAVGDAISENAAEGQLPNFLGHLLGVIPWARAVSYASTDIKRNLRCPVTGITRPLQPLHLLTGSSDLAPRLGIRAPGPTVSLIRHDQVVNRLTALLTVLQHCNTGGFGFFKSECCSLSLIHI